MPKQDTTNHTPAKQFRFAQEVIDKLDALCHWYSVDRTSMLKVLISDAFNAQIGPKKNLKKSKSPS